MKRRSTIKAAGLALLASLLCAAPAMAAPALTVEVDHYPGTVYKNDRFLGYVVNVENSGDEATSGPLTVSIELPPGLSLKRAKESGWSCEYLPDQKCTSSAAVAPGASYPPLDLTEVRIEETAGDEPLIRVVAEGGGAPASASAEHSFAFDPPLPFDFDLVEVFARDEAGNDVTQAGAHPYEAAAVLATTKLRGSPVPGGVAPYVVEDVHGGAVELPPGLIGNPEAAEAVCRLAELQLNECPQEAAVGGTAVFASATGVNPPGPGSPRTDAVYRMAPESGYPASFGFKSLVGGGPTFIVRAKVLSDGNYGIATLIPLVPQEPKFFGADFAFCGFGAKATGAAFEGCLERDDPEANTDAFVTLSTDCSIGKPVTRFWMDSWVNRGAVQANGMPIAADPNWKRAEYQSPELTGCVQLTEEWVNEKSPSLTMQPDRPAADSPAGYTAQLHIPQSGLEDPNGLGTSHLKRTTVVLPPGVSFNPAIAHGLEACTLQQIGYLGNGFPYPNRIRFDTSMPRCPDASKIGTAKVETPILADAVRGSVYLAAQKANPFGTNYAIYLALEEPEIGLVAKLPGRVDLDPATGQITAVFDDNPQLPFEDLELKFFGGERAPLANPVTCGTHGVNTAFAPWSAANPDSPRPDEIARSTDPVQITAGANGAPCVSNPAQRPFAIGSSAGASQPFAGATSPFSIRVTRPDGSQELDRLEIAPPPGLVASLNGIPYCPEAQIAAATYAASGQAERATPSCPPASQVGTVEAGAGPGATPLYVPGKLYLAGPYKGQPLSVVAITPAVAGPFDLGNVVIRSALHVDPHTARITAVTDPIPRIFAGIPLRIRDIRINLDRPNWTQNPTNCSAMAVDVTAYGSNGAVARPSSRFQVGGCERLAFKPKLKLRFKGGTKRSKNPAIRAVLTQPPGQANISRAEVILPRTAFIDQAHISNPCTRVQFAVNACPPKSILGTARAWSPLLAEPVQGYVYFRSNGGERELPDMVASLKGQVDVELIGFIDAVPNKQGTSRVRNTFAIVPDVPVSRFELNLKGGKVGLIENSVNLCKVKKARNRATVRLEAHNGSRQISKPVIKNDCKKGRKGGKRGKGGKRAR